MSLSLATDNKRSNSENDELMHLLALCKLADKQAFHQLYQRTSARLNGIAYRITRNVDSANEVLQEAFLQIWKNCHDYQSDKSDAFVWLSAIVRYRAYDRLKYDKRRHQTEHVPLDESNLETLSFNPTSGDEYSPKTLNRCLAKLEKKQSQTIMMAYLYGYSRDDISAHFNTPVNTIKSWIRRGLGKLQLCLSN